MPADARPIDGREPWLRYRDTSLYVVPSVHYRLVFAQAVYEACWRRPFDTIAVELSSMCQRPELLAAIAGMPPSPGIILFPRKTMGWMRVPFGLAARAGDDERRPVEAAVCLPVSPCDSIVMALRCPTLLAERWPGWHPDLRLIDRNHTPVEREEPQWAESDDYEVRARGLAAFFERFEESGRSAGETPVDTLRERTMAARLRRLLDEGRETLFVCGAAHWGRIRRLLDGGTIEDAAADVPEPVAPVVASLDPSAAWFLGWLDDIPRVAWEFQQACRLQTAVGFDKRAAVETVMKESLEEARDAGRPPSLRRHLSMRRFGERMLAAAGRWAPTLDDDIAPAARACVGDGFADTVKEVGLRYPAPVPEGVPRAEFLFTRDDGRVLRVGSTVFLVPTRPAAFGSRRRVLPVAKRLILTPGERDEVRRRGRYLRDWPAEARLRWAMDARVRELVRQARPALRAHPFRGSMAQGPDWRMTIRSLARGRNELYVREAARRRWPSPPKAHAPRSVTPVVWIFDDQCPISNITGTEQPLTESDWYYSSFLYVAREWRFDDGLIRAFELAAFVDLFLSRAYAGPRFSSWPPNKQMAADMEYVRGIPPEKRCRCHPWGEPDLARFGGVNQAMAAAVKYATDEVIIVCHPAKRIAPPVVAYANDRRVTLRRVSIEEFPRERLDRFRMIHFVPSPGDPFQPPYEWCSRFVPAT